jgi:murein DD-endopeptidase MepM/ murein hydrolase activator NlpD
MWGRFANIIAGLAIVLVVAACSRSGPAPVVYGTKTSPGNSPGTQVAAPAKAVSVSSGSYRVAAQETLYSISRRSGVSLGALISANKLQPPYRLRRGQTLHIPSLRYHKVTAGETLYSISRRYRVSVYTLARGNNLALPYSIRSGQRLALPGTNKAVRAPKTQTAAVKPRRAQPKRKPVRTKPPARSGSRFAWPVQGRVISRFGVKPNGLHNDGINIAVKQGTAVRAADNGVVVYAGNELRGFGNLLLLRHQGGWLTAYGHNQALVVKVGDIVRRGQRIARSGATGNITRPQLHFEVRKGRRAVNPARYLTSKQAMGQALGQVLSSRS